MGVKVLWWLKLLYCRSLNPYESLRTNIAIPACPLSFTLLSLKLTVQLNLNTLLLLMYDSWSDILVATLMHRHRNQGAKGAMAPTNYTTSP